MAQKEQLPIIVSIECSQKSSAKLHAQVTVGIDFDAHEGRVSFQTATHTIVEVYGCRTAAVRRLYDLATGVQSAGLANCYLGARVRYD